MPTFTPSEEAFSDLLQDPGHGMLFIDDAWRESTARSLAERLRQHQYPAEKDFQQPIVDDYGQQGTVTCGLVLSRWRRE